jgi:8-oxo-dGTP pyrophosphatase MutT (NUDIX family)
MRRNPWKTLDSRVAYKNPWLRVREDRVVRPDGGPGIYGVVEIRPSVGILAFNSNDELAIVGQWRYALDRYSYEIVRGGSGEGDTDMLAVAQRELHEEAGYEAQNWEAFGSVDVCNGVTTDVQHFFIARDLRFVGTNQDPFEEIVTEWYSFEHVLAMIAEGQITEVCSVAAVLKYDRVYRRGQTQPHASESLIQH